MNAALIRNPAQETARHYGSAIGRIAVRSLFQELALYPKPGLVSMVDSGSHDDMDAGTFMRSLFALRHYFIAIAEAGCNGAPFSTLQTLGLAAEKRMLDATGGINTHRGAIFCLGLLCAAIGLCCSRQVALCRHSIRELLLAQWGTALDRHMQAVDSRSHGGQVALLHAVGGAREQAAAGFPALFEVALPALEDTLRAGRGWHCASVDAFFALMAYLEDTNVYFRGGLAAAGMVKQEAWDFVRSGGTARNDWRERAIEFHRLLVRHRLSPGGAADLLAATFLVHQARRIPNRYWRMVASGCCRGSRHPGMKG